MKVKQFNVCLLFAVLAQQTLFAAAYANPTGATIVNGQVNFSQPDATTLQISSSPGAIINWQDFNISPQEMTRFVQGSAASAILNRVVGGNASQILGQLQSNGKVFLINPNGLVIGQDAVIDTAAFIGSTLNISDQDFLNGRMHFEGEGAADLDNQGYIHAGKNGDILLIAPNITNSGVLEVDGGNILLAAGQSITIASLDDANISFEVQAAENTVTNLGQLIANNGAANMFAGTLTHSGSVSANGITTDAAGNIRLVATGTNWIEGDVIATGNQGGDIQLLGAQVGLDGNAVIDASGTNGGGQILIGGDYQGQGDVMTARASYVGEDVQIRADALDNGDGGKVIVWADESTRMYGSISATGGALSGDGGFVETSGAWFDLGTNVPDVSASNGEGGTWLIDPNNIDIVSGTGTGMTGGPIFTSSGQPAILDVGQIKIAMDSGSNVEVRTGTAAPNDEAGNITWGAGVNLDLDDVANQSLTLSAHNDVNISGTITRQGGISQGVDLIIIADSDGDNAGGFNLSNTASLDLSFGGFAGSLDVSAGGNIVLDGAINAAGGSITLNTTGGSISQALSASTSANDLVLTSSGNVDFLGSNSFTNLNALVNNGSNLRLINNGPLTIDVINAIGGAVRLNNTGDVNQGGAIGGLVAASLDITTTGGDVSLFDSRNDLDSILASATEVGGGSLVFNYRDVDDLTVLELIVNNNSSSPSSSFADITTGGDMTLDGNVIVNGGVGTFSGITLNAQNGSNIIHQSGTITTDYIYFQNDGSPGNNGAVGSAVNPVQTAAFASAIDINLGEDVDSVVTKGGSDLYIDNSVGNVTLSYYLPLTPSALHIQNTAIAGDIDLQSVQAVDSQGTLTPGELTATSITLKANGSLLLPAFFLPRSGPGLGARLSSTIGDIFLEGQNLQIDIGGSLSAAGNITLVSNSGALIISESVDSLAGNVELIADDFSISNSVTAQNQVVVREYSAVNGLEINDATPNSGFATLTTSDLRQLSGTDLGIVLGNDLAHTGSKSVVVVSAIDSADINGPALTFDTTNNSTGSSSAMIEAGIDFQSGNENLLFTGNGMARIGPNSSSGSNPVVVDIGSGNFSSSASQLVISGGVDSQVGVSVNNASITGDLLVSSGSSAGSAALFAGKNLSLQGALEVLAGADSAEIRFTSDVNVTSPTVVNLSGGTSAGAFARLSGGDIDITASSIQLQVGEAADTDAYITAADGLGSVVLDYTSCLGCKSRIVFDPNGNGLSESGIRASTISLNGDVDSIGGNLNPTSTLNSLFERFSAVPLTRRIDDREDERKLRICS